jgi:hypothetical protein
VTVFLLTACHGDGPTSPDPASQPHGTLSGAVTLGPNCPAETPANPCPPAPGAFALRKVLVYDLARTRVVVTVDIDSHGFYIVSLVPGQYTVDLQKSGADTSRDVPATVTILKDLVTSHNISIDTGIR